MVVTAYGTTPFSPSVLVATALPAAISSISTSAHSGSAAPGKPVVSVVPHGVGAGAGAAMEASPSVMFANGPRRSFSELVEAAAAACVVGREDQSMCVDES